MSVSFFLFFNALAVSSQRRDKTSITINSKKYE